MIYRLLYLALILPFGGCGTESSDGESGGRHSVPDYLVTPNLWTWSSRHLGRSVTTYALFDQQSTPPALIVGRVPAPRNVPTEFFAFELLTLNRTLHLKSFGAFQPHANCISGDFELTIEACREGARFPLCARLIDLESGRDIVLQSFPEFEVSVPSDWQRVYGLDQTLGAAGAEVADYLDLTVLLTQIDDRHAREDRERVTSRFLKGAFDLRAGLAERLDAPGIANRRCVDSGSGVIDALKGKDNARPL